MGWIWIEQFQIEINVPILSFADFDLHNDEIFFELKIEDRPFRL